jgi:hypothetical protein
MKKLFAPSSSIFGRLFIEDVLEYYDGPVIATLSDELDHDYLALLVERKIKSQQETWIVVQVSEPRLHEILAGNISLRKAIVQAETGKAYYFAILGDSSLEAVVEPVIASGIPDSHLPSEDYDLEFQETEIVDPQEDLQIRALRINRFIMHLRLTLEKNRTEAPISLLGDALNGLQSLMYSIGQSLFTESSAERGPVSSSIVQSHELYAYATLPGSFIIEMVSAPFTTLYGEIEICESMGYLQKLIEAREDPEILKALFEKLKTRVSSNLYVLLKALTSETDIKRIDISWASPQQQKSLVSLRRDEALILRDYLADKSDVTTETVVLEGRLVGAHLTTERFTLVTIENLEINGKCTGSSLIHVNGKTLGGIYSFTLEKSKKSSYIKAEVDTDYTLQKIEDTVPTYDWPDFLQQ